MDLTYSDEQTALRDSAEKYLRERYTAAERGVPGAAWRAFADLGWLGLVVPERFGGLDASVVEAALIAEAMGRNLVAEPYVACAVLAPTLLAGAAREADAKAALHRLVAGEVRTVLAESRAGELAAEGDRLTGCSLLVPDGGLADVYLVAVAEAEGGIGLLRVARGAPGLTVAGVPTVDGRAAVRLTFAGTPGERLDGLRDAGPVIAVARDAAVAVAAADLVGAMQAALDATVAYAKMRVQFGQPIGANQVIKHRLVDMAVRCEEARSSALLAAIRCSDGADAATRARAVSSAKLKVSRAARFVTEGAVQVHGGMGVTDELDIGGYLKRTIAFDAAYGTPTEHRRRYAAYSRHEETRA